MMTKFLGLAIGLLSTTMAAVIHSRGGDTYCNGMVCPAGTGCYIESRVVNGVDITRKNCFNTSGHVVKEEITQEDYGAGSSIFLSDDSKVCTITNSVIDGKINSTKVCRDKNGELRPMTPEEEEDFERRKAEAEAAAEKARETGRRLYAVAMRNANESVQKARRTSDAALEHARRMQQQAMENVKRMTAHIGHMADRRHRKFEERQEDLARRLEEAAARREMVLEQAAARREQAQAEREMRREQAQARREMKRQEHDLKMSGFLQDLPNFVDGEDW